MADRVEVAIAVLALTAAALVLAAPVLGRSGAPLWADVFMASAAMAGVAGFALAGWSTWRAARRPPPERNRPEEGNP